VSSIDRPDHFAVANAIGAAIASVSGQVDQVVHVDAGSRAAIIERLVAEATDRAAQAGADRAATEVVEVDEVPLAYVTTPTVRIRVKVAGPVAEAARSGA
jgi:hypothetical protein